ncbi:MAG: glycoside hydrolase family 5 protein [Defluviitaleaceae bacterium]|nr:glycoside hydrolase family 5 protein [Defluviitaleaceae bacterium]
MKIFFFTILIIFIFCACGSSPHENFEISEETEKIFDDSHLQVSAPEFVRLMGNGINLGNTMEAVSAGHHVPRRATHVYETMWGNPVTTREMVAGMRNAGFTTLRIPVAWSNAMDIENGDLEIAAEFLERVEEIVNFALDENMFVIVNAHWDRGWWSLFGHPELERRHFAMEIFSSMWAQISNHFENYDLRLIFEPANEEWGSRFNDATTFSPTGGVLTVAENYALLTHLSQKFVDQIRAGGGKNPDRFLLMRGYNTDIARTIDRRFQMPDDPRNRLLLGIHYYTPWEYVGESPKAKSWGKSRELAEMNDLLEKLTVFSENGYGVVLGEWGVLKNDGDDRLLYFENFLDNAELHGFAPILWDRGGGHGFFERFFLHKISDEGLRNLFETRYNARKNFHREEIVEQARENLARRIENAE